MPEAPVGAPAPQGRRAARARRPPRSRAGRRWRRAPPRPRTRAARPASRAAGCPAWRRCRRRSSAPHLEAIVRPVDLADRLAARTLELIDIASESRDEARLAAHVGAVLAAGGVPVRDLGDSCVLAGQPEARVVLAGHLDTVPA